MIGDAYDHVVVMFSDIVGFSTMSSTMSAVEVFLMLTNLYYAFDRLVDKFGVYKVETIGDGYMIAAGMVQARHCSSTLTHLGPLPPCSRIGPGVCLAAAASVHLALLHAFQL